MRGRIESGQSVLLQPCSFEQVQVGDVVFTRWKGNYLLHLVVELGKNDALIGNTLGKTNGWVSREDILAVVREVTD